MKADKGFLKKGKGEIARLVEKWDKVLSAGQGIQSDYVKAATAVVLENTQNLSEASGAMGVGGSTSAMPTVAGYGAGSTDTRMPNQLVPMVRRAFPELLAHDVVGVQPMSGPVGFAFALRFKYGANGKNVLPNGATIPGTDVTDELGYNNLDSGFTGTSGNITTTPTTSGAWAAYTGAGSSIYGGTVAFDGQGADLADAQWWGIDQDMPMLNMTLDKSVVEAKVRKIGAHWSLELEEDANKQFGINIDGEMANMATAQITAETDRQLLTELVKAAITDNNISVWDPVTADGRNQQERIGTLYTHIIDRANEVGVRTRMGAANYAIADPRTMALFERLRDFKTFDTAGSVNIDSGKMGVAKVGTLRQSGITAYRDSFAGGNYVLLGYKGNGPTQTGIVFCPYVPVETMRAVDPNTFTPKMGVRTRYGILSNLLGAGNFGHFIQVANLNSSVAADGGRIFMA
jgi:hypothetical protein